MRIISLLLLMVSIISAQTPLVFFDGKELPADAGFARWGFTDNNKITVENSGYTPGSSAIWWETSDWNWQGFETWREAATDLSNDWSTNHLEFKVKAPAGINTLAVYLYDFNDERVGRTLEEYDSLYNGEWQHIMIPLDSLYTDSDTVDFDETQVYWLKIEAAYENETIPEALLFDDIWVGNPDISRNIVIFNGWETGNDIGWGKWGFGGAENNILTTADEGYTPGSPAIYWEKADWSWQGVEFWFNQQDMSYSATADTFYVKIKAPAGINNLSLGWYDWNDNYSWYELIAADQGFDGTWKELAIPLTEFVPSDGFDYSTVYKLKIEAAYENLTVPELLYWDDIWVGNPNIPDVDIVAPAAPNSISATSDVAFPYTNIIYWEDVEGETGESYNVYGSMQEITDLESQNVIEIESGIEEGTQSTAHSIAYPMMDGQVSYYYAVECVDNYGNKSETFTAMPAPFANTGKAKMVVSLSAPVNFIADGDLTEWSQITPLHFDGDNNLSNGAVDNADDLSVNCYMAMDNEYLYIAFDVIDDFYTWAEDNTQPWWDDEAIEFFIGLYKLKSHHKFFQRGDEPDYRLLFLPDTLWMHSEDRGLANGSENYYFSGLGESDYVVEARIPWSTIMEEGDNLFQPVEGMMIPLEILVADSDIKDGGNEGRLQWGSNAAINPYHGGPSLWSNNWIGLPEFVTSIEEVNEIPISFSLEQNYPNPFNPTTSIKYSIKETGQVNLAIYNIVGQKVVDLVDNVQSAGVYNLHFNAEQLASGIYIYSLKAGKFNSSKKMILLK